MISFRRTYIDKFLQKSKIFMRGNVLDIGGHKIHKRGNFIPPKDQSINWEYLNIDKEKKPHIIADIEKYIIEKNKYDTVLLIEVIEYIDDAEKLLKNIYEGLNNNSYLILSAPLFNSLHGDFEYDKVRYSETKLKELFKKNNFTIEKFWYMGGLGSVIYDFLRSYFMNSGKKLMIKILFIFKYFFIFIDFISKKNIKYINTGYFFVLKK